MARVVRPEETLELRPAATAAGAGAAPGGHLFDRCSTATDRGVDGPVGHGSARADDHRYRPAAGAPASIWTGAPAATSRAAVANEMRTVRE